MNIGFFTDVYTPLVDGVVRSIILYKKEIERQGHRVFIFAPEKIKTGKDFNFEWDFKDDERTFRFKAVDSVFVPGYPLSIPISFKATQKIPKLKLDIVHCHTPVTLGMLGDIVALFSNIPKVYTYHTYYPEYVNHYVRLGKFKTEKAVKKFDIFYCNRSDRVIVPSLKLKHILLQWGVKSNVDVLPTGIDFNEFSKGINKKNFLKKYNIGEDEKILLFVGRLGREKNVRFLIDVANQLNNKNENFKLVIVGDGKEKNNLLDKVKMLALEDKVIFTGFLSRKDTINAFTASDIFVFASTTDTQGLVLLEAAACGKPIVMVKDPGLSEIIIDGESGFTVPENVDIFSQKVEKLLNDKGLYDRMSGKSRKLARNFSISHQAEKLVNTYQEVIEEYKYTSLRMKFWSNLNKEIKIPKWIKVNLNKEFIKKFLRKGRNIFKI